jgi:hypothetical protein
MAEAGETGTVNKATATRNNQAIFFFMKSPRVNWPCALNNAAKLTEGIEIQIALGNLLSIRSRKDFQYRLAQLRLHLRREILCLRRDLPCSLAEKYRRRAQQRFVGSATSVTRMETAQNLRIEFRARNL